MIISLNISNLEVFVVARLHILLDCGCDENPEMVCIFPYEKLHE